MFTFLRSLANSRARHLTGRRCALAVAATARVDYTRIYRRPPAKLTIGSGTIFGGAISSDRPEAEVTIGSNTFIGNSLFVCASRIVVGDDVLISWGCTIVDHNSHATEWGNRARDVADTMNGIKDWSHVNISPVIVENKAWIGFNVIILKGVSIGEGAIVGAGSVVTKDVPAYCVVAGSPARIVRQAGRGSQTVVRSGAQDAE